jgi:DNA-binding LacI/PurR family transcriptional regulator
VRQPLVESGRRGAKLLLDALTRREQVGPLRELLPLELVVRATTGPAASG